MMLGSRTHRIGSAALALFAAAALAAPASAAQSWVLDSVDVFPGTTADVSRGQGVTTDGTKWFFSGTNALEQASFDSYDTLKLNSAAIDPALAAPNPLAYKGLNHIGDIDYADGKLYISLDSSQRDPVTGGRYETPVFAIYDAETLTFTGQAYQLNPPHGVSDVASWVAVDFAAGLGYGMAYDNAPELAIYNLADWSFKEYLPLSKNIDQAQGCKIFGGSAYCASDDATKTIRRIDLTTGEVEDLFSIKTPYPQELEGLAVLQTSEGLTLNVLNREQTDPNDDSTQNVSFYHYRLVSSAAVPEPASWAMMLGGFGLLGGTLRRRATRTAVRFA